MRSEHKFLFLVFNRLPLEYPIARSGLIQNRATLSLSGLVAKYSQDDDHEGWIVFPGRGCAGPARCESVDVAAVIRQWGALHNHHHPHHYNRHDHPPFCRPAPPHLLLRKPTGGRAAFLCVSRKVTFLVLAATPESFTALFVIDLPL